MRLFAAVQPPAPVLDHLEQALDAVRGPGERSGGVGPLRWAPPEDRHITLAFFGEVPAGVDGELEAGLAALAAASAPFDARLRGAGVFDRRVFWIGVGGQVDRLGTLVAGAVDLAAEVTGRGDSRVRSRAHLTVARVRSQARTRARPYRRRDAGTATGPGGDSVAALAHALAVYAGPEWTVDRMALVSSRPGEGRGGGPLYRTERVFRLGDVTDDGPGDRTGVRTGEIPEPPPDARP